MSKIQYTIRSIPIPVDRVIRKRAAQSGQSFNKTVVDLLSLQTLGTTKVKRDDIFKEIFNSNSLDAKFDEAITEQSKIDEKLWR